MAQRSLTASSASAGSAVSLAFLLIASVAVWAEFGAIAVSMLRRLTGG